MSPVLIGRAVATHARRDVFPDPEHPMIATVWPD